MLLRCPSASGTLPMHVSGVLNFAAMRPDALRFGAEFWSSGGPCFALRGRPCTPTCVEAVTRLVHAGAWE
eukprot:7370285-Alexandrium_andersonii.AAC.1